MTEVQTRWFTTFLATMGATLTGALLLWIASNQVSIVTSQAVLQEQFEQQTKALIAYNDADRAINFQTNEYFAKIWPRLRVHGENVSTLKRYIETLCNCDIELKTPERF